jgi:catechol 2,3-dioxygenase-like lactoylglutathione lyase family enzyme
MTLVTGIHHVTSLTRDLDRLIRFYQRIFDAEVLLDLTEEGLRHAFIQVGPHTVLHPFQVPGVELPPGDIPMFARGRLDHVALHAATEAAFRELHQRLVAEGATDGIVTDMGSLLLFNFADPDEAQGEVVWPKPDVPVEQTLPRAAWTTVDLAEDSRPEG